MARFLLLVCGAVAMLTVSCAPPPAMGQSEAISSAITIVGSHDQAVVPFRLIDNRIFVDAKINGEGPFAMIFDTGGANVVTPEVAARLGLELRDEFSMPGAGESVQPAWRARVDQAALGDIRQTNIEFTVLSLDVIRQAIGFERLDGLFGHELLRRFVVSIDYDAGELRFAEPGLAPAHWFEGEELGFEFIGNLPGIRVGVDNLIARAAIDTGDRSSLTLFAPFVADHGLRERAGGARMITGWGVGGPIAADVARVGSLRIGGFDLPDVVTRMPVVQSGVFASRIADASIGNGVMKRFRVTFDYPRQRLYLAPGPRFSEPDPLDRSGVWLRLAPDSSFEIADVAEGGPAALAGLRPGEHVVAVDGVLSTALSLLDVRAGLAAAPAGATIELIVRGAAGERRARLQF